MLPKEIRIKCREFQRSRQKCLNIPSLKAGVKHKGAMFVMGTEYFLEGSCKPLLTQKFINFP